jgi:hypothetical protein
MIAEDEAAAKIELTKRPSTGAVTGSIDKLDEQLRVSVEALLHPSPPRKPVEELNDLLLAISHRLDQESSERKAIDSRLAAIESKMKRRSSRGLTRYVVAICIVAAILAWQSYGQAAKQVIATRAPELGWSPETKQRIASWVQRLGWMPPPAGSAGTAVQPSAPETATGISKAPLASSPDLEQVQQQIKADIVAVRRGLERPLADMRETTEQLAAGQDQIVREITKLQATDEEILAKIPVPPPRRPAPARKPTSITPPPSSRVQSPR